MEELPVQRLQSLYGPGHGATLELKSIIKVYLEKPKSTPIRLLHQASSVYVLTSMNLPAIQILTPMATHPIVGDLHVGEMGHVS